MTEGSDGGGLVRGREGEGEKAAECTCRGRL